jgi:hypothetical protein
MFLTHVDAMRALAPGVTADTLARPRTETDLRLLEPRAAAE